MTPINLDALVAPVVVALLPVCAEAIPNRVVLPNPRTTITAIAETDSAATAGKLLDSMLFWHFFPKNDATS